MRFDCTLDGLTDNWVDVAERWTRKEISAMASEREPEAFVGWLRNKITACHIETVDGDPITDPAQLTPEIMEERIDIRLYDFLGTVLLQAVGELRQLGPLSGRRLSPK